MPPYFVIGFYWKANPHWCLTLLLLACPRLWSRGFCQTCMLWQGFGFPERIHQVYQCIVQEDSVYLWNLTVKIAMYLTLTFNITYKALLNFNPNQTGDALVITMMHGEPPASTSICVHKSSISTKCQIIGSIILPTGMFDFSQLHSYIFICENHKKRSDRIAHIR